MVKKMSRVQLTCGWNGRGRGRGVWALAAWRPETRVTIFRKVARFGLEKWSHYLRLGGKQPDDGAHAALVVESRDHGGRVIAHQRHQHLEKKHVLNWALSFSLSKPTWSMSALFLKHVVCVFTWRTSWRFSSSRTVVRKLRIDWSSSSFEPEPKIKAKIKPCGKF